MATTTPPQAPSALQKRYRTLAVVKQESITRVEKQLEDSVFVWPHLLVREFMSAVLLTVMLTIVSVFVAAPLDVRFNVNFPPPAVAKAPWYFLGLQELLHYFPPTLAGVLLPTFILGGLAAIPYIDNNPSRAYNDRKFSIALFTMFFVFLVVITVIGSFFRGGGWTWSWPWQGMYFDL